jgi:DNA-binding beta-propeller fold protein YncE
LPGLQLWRLDNRSGEYLNIVGASLLAKVVNDNTGSLTPRGDLEFFASQLAPTICFTVNELRVIDTVSEEFVGIIEGFDQPHGVAVTPDGKTYLVCTLAARQSQW